VDRPPLWIKIKWTDPRYGQTPVMRWTDPVMRADPVMRGVLQCKLIRKDRFMIKLFLIALLSLHVISSLSANYIKVMSSSNWSASFDAIEYIKKMNSSLWPGIANTWSMERDGLKYFIVPCYIDAMLVKKMPQDLDELKAIAFMQGLYSYYSRAKPFGALDYDEVTEGQNGYRFTIKIKQKKVSEYQTKYESTYYSLVRNEKVLFERSIDYTKTNRKAKIVSNLGSILEIQKLFLENFGLRSDVPVGFIKKSRTGEIRSFSLVLMFELPKEKH